MRKSTHQIFYSGYGEIRIPENLKWDENYVEWFSSEDLCIYALYKGDHYISVCKNGYEIGSI